MMVVFVRLFGRTVFADDGERDVVVLVENMEAVSGHGEGEASS